MEKIKSLKAINKHHMSTRREHLAITTTTGLSFVKRSELLYCCSDGAYTNIYLEGGRKLTVSKNNNSYNCIKMSNGEELSVSRNRKKELMECFVKI